MEILGYETIDIHDEKAKELAQILMNDKAIAILHLIEETPMSISEIARELNLPISTVSYHIDKMMRVGLVEIAGKKYGKRLQEVKLYRASNRPILLLPRKSAQKVHKKTFSLERLHVISLGLAGFVSLVVYKTSSALLKVPGVKEVANVTYAASPLSNTTTSSPSRLMVATTTNTVSESVTVAKTTASQISTSSAPAGGSAGLEPALLAVLAFIITFVLAYYLLKRGE